MPINQKLVDQINGNKERASMNPNAEVIRLERELMQMQQMLIKQMQINQETLLQVNKVMAKNEDLEKKVAIMERQIDFKQLQRVHAIK